jgi:hypothetical protein
VTVKNVVEGASVKAGDQVLRIVDHGTLWLDARVYEQDMPFVRVGQNVTATIAARAGGSIDGKIIFVAPQIDPATRTATVRIEIANSELKLRPGMYANAEIVSELSRDAVLVPREAVIDTGTRTVAFVATGNGRFEPRALRIGASGAGGVVEVLGGLAAGETVVTSGQFLLDAESRMKEAIQRHLDKQLLAPAEGGPTIAAAMPVAPAMPAAASTTRAALGQTSPEADAVYGAYLAVAQNFAAAEPTSAASAVAEPLTAAARRLAESDAGKAQSLSSRLLDATARLQASKPETQAKVFKDVSDAVLAMVDVLPPSDALGGQLFVAHCPMAFDTGADWLQAKEAIANPYMADMRACGEIKRTLRIASSKARP